MFGGSTLVKITRGLVVVATMSTALIVSVGLDASRSSALGISAFCKTLISDETTIATKEIPPTSFSNYSKWAGELVPFYEKLASEAPNAATKSTLDEVVAILKNESKKQALTTLEAYVASHKTKFEAGAKALAKAIEACV